jgi:hypothetical protein
VELVWLKGSGEWSGVEEEEEDLGLRGDKSTCSGIGFVLLSLLAEEEPFDVSIIKSRSLRGGVLGTLLDGSGFARLQH